MIIKSLSDIVFDKQIPDNNGLYNFLVTEETTYNNELIVSKKIVSLSAEEIFWQKQGSKFQIRVDSKSFEQERAPLSLQNLAELLEAASGSVSVYPSFGVL